MLYVRDMGSVERLDSLTASGQPVVVAFEGGEALKLFGTGLFNPGTWKVTQGPNGPRLEINPIWEFVAIIAILAAVFIAALTLLILFRIVMAGLEYGYEIKIEELQLGGATIKAGDTEFVVTLPTLPLVLTPPSL